MDFIKTIKDGDTVPFWVALFMVLAAAIYKTFIELIPLIIVISVAVISDGSFDSSFFSSPDFCLTMVFYQVTAIMIINSRNNSIFDKELESLQKYLCVLFAILFTIIYVFTSKKIKLGIPDNYIFYFGFVTVIHGIYLKCNYGFKDYFEKIKIKIKDSNQYRIKK